MATMAKYVVGLVGILTVLAGLPAASRQVQLGKVAVTIDKGKVVFAVAGQEAGVYHTEGYSQPILWPVYAPGHVGLTRDWPMGAMTPGGSKDHPHHQSVWFCHGDVIPKGIELKKKVKGVDGVDFWSLAANHGVIVCTDVKKGASGPSWAGVATTN